MTRRIVLLPLAVALLAPAAASAQGTGTTTTPVAVPTVPATTPTTTAPAPAPTTTTAKPKPKPVAAPKQGTISVALEKVGSGTIITGQRFRVHGTVRPYVAGQKVTVRFYRRGRKIKAVEVAVQPSGGVGRFLVGYTATSAGTITVRASHRATAQLGTAVAKGRSVRVLVPSASAGSRGPVVRLLQTQLSSLGYVVGVKGVYDARTARAVLAFRKVTGMARTEVASSDVFRKLAAGGGVFHVRYPNHGKHVEGDLTHQVIALIGADGKVQRIYPTSSGKPSTPTVLGHFSVYRRDPGTNSEGMVYSDYFIRGYAIHGYAQVPVYAASHGCLRVPVPDAVPIYNWLSFGDKVDVYYR